MRDAVLTVSPKRQYRGLRVPTTFATTGPEWKPTRMLTLPRLWSSSSTGVRLAASIAKLAKYAMRRAWSTSWSATRLATAMYASPIVSTLNTSILSESLSKAVYNRSNIWDTLCGSKDPEMSVKPTMSEKKIVTMSRCSGSTFLPSRRASAICLGKTSYSKVLARLFERVHRYGHGMFKSVSSIAFSRRSTSMRVGRCAGALRQQSLMSWAMSSGQPGGICGRFSCSAPPSSTTWASTDCMSSP
mmetsp:Transcript_70434/g.215742  ORF Transcript_70434/g.215742 Transcript_70434/m.215742 type:complete len:244 (+) Transcript_70434:94-825(+)